MFSNIRDKAIVALYRAKTSKELATAFFGLFSELIPNHLQVLVLHSDGSKAQCFCSTEEHQPLYEEGVAKSHVDETLIDYALENPVQLFTRTSQFSSKKIGLNGINKAFMAKMRAEYAVSLIAGGHSGWQASLTILRTKEQGSFSEKELENLQAFRLYLQSTIERVIGRGEGELCRKTLETFIWGLPSAVIVLNWDLKVLYFNASALELSECWKKGPSHIYTKRTRTMVLPGDILAAIQREKARLSNVKNYESSGNKSLSFLEIKHSSIPGLMAKAQFQSNLTATLGGGTFLITLHRQSALPDDRQTYDGFVTLSRRERDVVLLAAKGKRSNEIAAQLGTAPITVRMQLYSAYKKLGVKTRYELVSMFSRHPLLADRMIEEDVQFAQPAKKAPGQSPLDMTEPLPDRPPGSKFTSLGYPVVI